MDITWFGHSCFRIKGKETSVITDPYSSGLGYPVPNLQAEVVTVSHYHPGHNNTAGVSGVVKVLDKPGEFEVRDVLVLAWRTFHDAEEGKSRGNNLVFLLEFEGVTLCHLGDIGHLPIWEQMPEVSGADILFLPVGGGSTISVAMAAQIMRHIAPKIVIPMHYKTPVLRRELEPLDKFLKEIGAGPREPQLRLTVNRSSLPVSTQLTILNYPQK